MMLDPLACVYALGVSMAAIVGALAFVLAAKTYLKGKGII